MKNNTKNQVNVRKITACAMLTAVAIVLQFIELSIPLMPPFIKLDFSDLPEIIGAFAYGPLAGIIIALLKNLIHLPMTGSGCIGELSNFILGAVFAGVAGIIYKKNKTKKGALLGGIIGALAMAIVCVGTNYFIIYPLYYSVLGLPEATVLSMYQVLLPNVKNIFEALLIFNLPFTFVKGAIVVGMSMIIYKPLSPFLHKSNVKNK